MNFIKSPKKEVRPKLDQPDRLLCLCVLITSELSQPTSPSTVAKIYIYDQYSTHIGTVLTCSLFLHDIMVGYYSMLAQCSIINLIGLFRICIADLAQPEKCSIVTKPYFV